MPSSAHTLLLLFTLSLFHLSLQKKPLSLSFPLTSAPISKSHLSSAKHLSSSSSPPFPYTYKSLFRYSMALIISLPIGTPAQSQQMVVDTGSQLSWIQCRRRPSFDPSLSSSFSVLPCTHPICKPRIPDFTLPTTCDQNRLCHYSYFYADGTLAEGNLVREKITLSNSQTTPPLILGCAAASAPDAEGILGINRGRLSFVSQAKIPSFSYCIPVRRSISAANPTGMFYLGHNPNSRTFRYIPLLTFPQGQRMPNLDPLAYTVPMSGISVGRRRLNVSASVFRPDSGGSGQTMIDSGTQYTFLVDAAYQVVKEHVARAVGPRLKKDYVYQGALDMCFDGNAIEIGRLIGDMAFQFDGSVEISIGRDRILDHVGGGVHCVAIGRSEALGVASNIIGNFHQRNLWVEFDLVRRRVGFGVADCSKAV
ncbi:aspartic proteinase PCS1-like [Salvia hispanica]|uniref:aspartic proteinase PCS1-like n=1 Tax=Salvia hispanica TaxID=49212 RepID=UPI0020091F15|nr:aspartic proteinase PCS1-like [Salvia hispanica]